jgi:hypothetical protein
MNALIADFDDFSEKENRLDLIFKLKKEIPNYKVTLFTIPGLCSLDFCQVIAKFDWIQLALHGEFHIDKECKDWTKEKTIEYLDKYESWGCFQKIFRAPFWLSSKELRETLAERKYIFCENKDSDYIGKIYRLEKEVSVHGHIPNVCNNGIEEKFDYYKSLRNNSFRFINELYD